MDWNLLLAAVLGAVATAVVGPLLIASTEIRRHDRQVKLRDEDLEEWIITHHRQLMRDFRELAQEANARGVAKGGTIPAGQAAIRTNLLYAFREEQRQAHAFVLGIEVEERWTHRLVRRAKGRPFPSLDVPTEAQPVVRYWSEGTRENALTWSLRDIIKELPVRMPSQAADPDAPRH